MTVIVRFCATWVCTNCIKYVCYWRTRRRRRLLLVQPHSCTYCACVHMAAVALACGFRFDLFWVVSRMQTYITRTETQECSETHRVGNVIERGCAGTRDADWNAIMCRRLKWCVWKLWNLEWFCTSKCDLSLTNITYYFRWAGICNARNVRFTKWYTMPRAYFITTSNTWSCNEQQNLILAIPTEAIVWQKYICNNFTLPTGKPPFSFRRMSVDILGANFVRDLRILFTSPTKNNRSQIVSEL